MEVEGAEDLDVHLKGKWFKGWAYFLEGKNATNQVEYCDGGCFDFITLAQVVGEILEKEAYGLNKWALSADWIFLVHLDEAWEDYLHDLCDDNFWLILDLRQGHHHQFHKHANYGLSHLRLG
jgi:hypothetical protein